MNKTSFTLAVLLSLLAAGHAAASHASQEAALVRALRAPHPARAGTAPIAIPDNSLTGRGAIATPDGQVHF